MGGLLRRARWRASACTQRGERLARARASPGGRGGGGRGGAAAGPGFGLGIVVGGHPVDQTAHYVLLAAPGRGTRGCVRPQVRQPGQFFSDGGLDTREPAALFAAGSLIQGWSGYQPGTPRLQACKTSNASLARLVFGPRFTYARRAVFEFLYGGCAGRQLALGRAAPKHAGSCWPSTAGEPGLWAGGGVGGVGGWG